MTGDLLPEDGFFTNHHHSCLHPIPSLRLITVLGAGDHLTGAGKGIVLLGYLMVNDLFNVEVAETTVVLRKPLR